MRALYFGLIAITFGSASLYLSKYFFDIGLWDDFVTGYTLVLVAYTCYLFALLFVHDLRPRRYPRYAGGKIAVLIPVFNEEPDLVERSIRAVVEAEGEKQVIVVDDGSTNGVQSRLRTLADELGFRLHEFPENAGKREALFYATKWLLDDDAEYVVTIDSDTVLDPAALVRVVEPLLCPEIGASTGDVQLLNERQNLLTRMIGTYYWIGLNIYKQAQSVIRSVVCCSGCLAAYRASVLRAIIDDFAGQTFLGEKCTHSEDRHLTNLVLKARLRRGLRAGGGVLDGDAGDDPRLRSAAAPVEARLRARVALHTHVRLESEAAPVAADLLLGPERALPLARPPARHRRDGLPAATAAADGRAAQLDRAPRRPLHLRAASRARGSCRGCCCTCSSTSSASTG